MNDLIGKVQVVKLAAQVIWYTPAGFSNVVTDAELVDGDEGGLLLIHNGWQYKVIAAEQVVRDPYSTRAHDGLEMRDVERVEYDQVNRGGVSTL